MMVLNALKKNNKPLHRRKPWNVIRGALFKQLGIVSKYDGPIEILANKSIANKTIGNTRSLNQIV